MFLIYISPQTKLIILIVVLVVLALGLLASLLWLVKLTARLEKAESEIEYCKTKLYYMNNKEG